MISRDLEKFYTPESLTFDLIKTIPPGNSYLEPSAGSGSWINAANHLHGTVDFKDLVPEHPSVMKEDYLKSFRRYDVVFGNPPYSLAVKFINKAFSNGAKHVCFLLPPSFKKQSIQQKINKYAHLTLNIDLPEAVFTLCEKQVVVPSVWQIWSISDTVRVSPKKSVDSTRFEFAKDWQLADIAVRRVGVKAGSFYVPSENLSPQSNLFLKFFEKMPISLMEGKVENEDFSLIKSVNKQEIIDYVEKFYQENPVS